MNHTLNQLQMLAGIRANLSYLRCTRACIGGQLTLNVLRRVHSLVDGRVHDGGTFRNPRENAVEVCGREARIGDNQIGPLRRSFLKHIEWEAVYRTHKRTETSRASLSRQSSADFFVREVTVVHDAPPTQEFD